MNSLAANLNSVVDEQGDSTTWPSDHGWDPPVATICTGGLSDHSRLHYHHAATQRQEWDWTDSQMILATQYATEEDELDCKTGILQADAMGGGPGLGLRQYSSAGFMSAGGPSMGTPSLGPGGGGNSTGGQSSWPGSLLNAVPLRQPIGLAAEGSHGGNCYSSPAMLYGAGLGAGAGGSNMGLAGSYYNTHQSQMQLDMEQRRLHDILKRGMYSGGPGAADLGSGARLGLNLGGRTYFSTEDMGARFHLTGAAGKRFRPNSPSMHVPSCQAEGCKADLSIAKHYHRRHKVCEYHSKAATVIITGNTQRFCQQCSRFHALSEFDEGKRSCRKRLADHNRRRRKPQPMPALPAPDSSTTPTSTTHEGASATIDNPAPNQTEDDLQDTKPGTAIAGRSQSDQQGEMQSKDGAAAGTKTASSSSTEQQTTSLLSTMTLAPSVSLTLQNGPGGRAEMQSTQSINMQVGSQDHSSEKEAAFINERHSAPPFLLNGPSLSLSSTGVSVGGDSVLSTNQQSPAHATHSFNEVELSVPWLRGHQVGSSPRMGLVQEGLGKLSSCHQTAEGSIMYSSSSRRNGNAGQYFNEHGRLLAEHLQTLQSQARNSAPLQDHQGAIKKENWMLESAAVVHEDQTVLSLLETATSNAANRKKETESNDCNRQQLVTAMDVDPHRHQMDEAHETAGATFRSHPGLGFLQGHHHHHHHHHHQREQQQAGSLHHNSASSSEMDHEASDAALSLHCMHVLRPLNESLYTTADFMKDGFLSS